MNVCCLLKDLIAGNNETGVDFYVVTPAVCVVVLLIVFWNSLISPVSRNEWGTGPLSRDIVMIASPILLLIEGF